MKRIFLVLLGLLLFSALATAQTSDSNWNGRASLETASDELTIAHSSLPIGSKVLVTNTRNGRSVEVTVTGRLSESDDRIVDISPGAWLALDLNVDNEIAISPIPESGGAAIAGEDQSDTQNAPVNITIYNYVTRQGSENVPAQDANIQPPLPEPVRYLIQVGAFATFEAADRTARFVKNAGIDVVQEHNGQYYRVVVPDVPAALVSSTVEQLGSLGFGQVWIREK